MRYRLAHFPRRRKKKHPRLCGSLRVMTAEDERGVRAAEAKRIGHGILHRCRQPLVPDQLKAASLVDILQIGHGRSHLIPERQYSNTGFQTASAAEKVASHRLG